MCTAISFKTEDHYFGRTLDLEYSYKEEVVVTPRKFPFSFLNGRCYDEHFAIIGMATVAQGYPLYYDAVNEKGLCMAGLSFPENAVYNSEREEKENVASFELIPLILASCETVDQARERLCNINITNLAFSQEYQPTPLHWIISDKRRSITVEQLKTGLMIYDNPVGVLANNPTFDYHMKNLCNYMNLTSEIPKDRFLSGKLHPYSKGMGAVGLPGDLSSASRFIRAVFVKENSVCSGGELESVGQFFHILGAVAQQKGCVRLPDNKYEITVYTSCCNTDKGIYYYTTYENSRISAIQLKNCDIKKENLTVYPLCKKPQIFWQN